MTQPNDIKRMIEQGMPGARVEVIGDGHHFEALIVSPDFAGKTMIQQHRMVYATLGDKMREEIHALSLRTLTPEEYAATGGA
ncbi:BolA family transcriptional regulator [Sulfurifustis variabilis]|uniref:BolA family transcriptional regulator n=2 Tax=Sulfurifustis variabilis TaxID=1675686 RepID=A0A1B4V172_9GAMM|nr:BolA family transcriptional regulator [Sulfurifustis variabilis]